MVTLESTATTITEWTASSGSKFLPSQTPEYYQQWMVQGQLRFHLNKFSLLFHLIVPVNWIKCLMYKREFVLALLSSVVRSSPSNQWGGNPHTFKWKLLQDIILHPLNQPMDGSHHHGHPSCRHHGPRLRLEGFYQAKHVSESSCKWPGVYVAVLHRTAIFTFAFVSDKCF